MNKDIQNKTPWEKASWVPFFIKCVMFCSLYFIRDIIEINISYYVIYAFAMYIILSSRLQECVVFFVAITSFTGAGFDGIFCTMLFICIFIKFYKYCHFISLTSVMIILMCIFETCHYIAGTNTTGGAWLTYVMILLSLLIIQRFPSENIDKAIMINYFISFSLFFVLMTILKMCMLYGSLFNLIEMGFRTEEYSSLTTSSGLMANQNYITSLSSLNLSLCVLMISKKRSKIPYIVAMIVFVFAGLLTVSKMFMAVLVFIALYTVYAFGKEKITYGIIAMLVIIMAGLMLYKGFGDTLIEMVINRFQTEELTSGRLSIINEFVEYMNENKGSYILGMGMTNSAYILERGVHSSVFELLSGWGIMGVVLGISYVWTLIYNAKLKMKREGYRIAPMNYFPILMFLGYSLIGMLFSSEMAISRMMICIYALQLKERE